MGKVSFPLGENAAVLQEPSGIKRWFLYHFTKAFYKRACSAGLLAEALKKYPVVSSFALSGRPIGPSDALHPAASTYGADADVNPPYGLYQFRYGKIGISGPETLMPLKGKNEFQVFAFPTVVQEPIIPDLLETGREHMHQIPADEFGVFQGNAPVRLTWLFPSGRERDLQFVNRKDTAVRNGNLVCISSEIFHRIAKSVEGFFYVRAPILSIKEIPEFSPFIGIAELVTGSGKNKASVFVKRIEPSKKLPFECIPQDFHPDKETFFYLA